MSRAKQRAVHQEQLLLNIRVHDAIAASYEHTHREIFNREEQLRLAAAVRRVIGYVEPAGAPLMALDIGCGSGNVSRQLIEAGCRVTGADVSRNFLAICDAQFAGSGRFSSVLLSGDGLSELPDATFDVVTAYSVLHHVPDYQRLLTEMARVTRPGGVIYIDHEQSERIHRPDAVYDEFTGLTHRRRSRLKRLLTMTRRRRRVVHFIRSILRPRFQTEGDLHVWPDDYIDFSLVRRTFAATCEILEDREYLLYPDGMDRATYDAYAGRCADVRLLIARKNAVPR